MTETNGQECLCPPVGHCWDCPVPREQGRQAKLDATTREHLDDRYLDMTCMRCEGKPIVAGTGHCETCITGRTTSWCDGTPHDPKAIPPLPLHDFRWSGDDPYIECARCGRIERDGRVIVEGRAS